MEVIIFFSGLLVLQYILLWYRVRCIQIHHGCPDQEVVSAAKVGVLVAARNEEENLEACLQALDQLDYPQDKITFYIGNDGSTDGTGAILNAWSTRSDNRLVISFSDSPGSGENGKARVLSRLAAMSADDYLLFTDADCVVPSEWVKTMMDNYRENYGMITGITYVGGSGFFSRMQAVDWWLVLGLVKVVSDWGICLTAMGNNMFIAADAYKRAGGFERVSREVTEDLAMAKQMSLLGYKPQHLVHPGCLVETKAATSWGALLDQRKRWARGALSLSWVWVALLGLQVVFFPLMIFALFCYPLPASLVWMAKIAAQAVFIQSFADRAQIKILLRDLIFFESYYLVSSWATLLYYIWPSPIRWKEREYN